MSKLMNTIFAAAALIVVSGAGAKAQVWTDNHTPNAIWITIYNDGHAQKLDYGCVPVGQSRTWTNWQLSIASYIFVRAEVKQNADCTGKTIHDVGNGTRVRMGDHPNTTLVGFWETKITDIVGEVVQATFGGQLSTKNY